MVRNGERSWRGGGVRAAGLALLSAILAMGAGCRGAAEPPETRTWPVMGTYCAVSVPAAEAGALDELAGLTRVTMARVNDRLSAYTDDSDVGRINRNAGSNAVSVSAMTLEVLALSRKYSDLSDGAFDPTIGPVVRLWGFGGGVPPERMPTPEAIEATLRRTGMGLVDADKGGVRLRGSGARLDLAGIAKGYAVDLCYDRALKERPGGNFMINLGGNIRCLGAGRGERPWTVGVRNPFNRDGLLGVIKLPSGMATATSGNYERFVTIEGKRYAHIIDPRTGYPVQGMAGVSVVAPTAVACDGLSTAFFVLGIEAGAKIVDRHPGVGVLFVPDRQPVELHLNPAFDEVFTPMPGYRSAVRLIAANGREKGG